MDLMNGIFGSATGIVIIALVLNAILWFFLPFAVFGTKKRLDTLIDLQARQLKEMLKLTQDIEVAVVPQFPKKWYQI